MPRSALLESATKFLEAASVAQKWRTVRAIEGKLEKAMTKAFRAQGKAFSKGFASLQGEFSEALSDDDWVGIWDDVAQRTAQLFLRPIQRAVQLSLSSAAEELITDLDVDYTFDLDNPRAVAYIEEHGADLVSGINETTRDYIRTIIRNGTDEGWSYNRMAQAISDRFVDFAVGRPQEHIESRAHLIAIQEVGEAYEHGNEVVIRDLQSAGLKMEKKWDTMSDDRVSQDICAPNAAQGWIPVDEPFQSGHQRALGHVACRCTTLYRRARG